MDENIFSVMTRIPSDDSVYRIAEISRRDRQNKAIPSIKVFSFSQHDNGKLSVDWNKKTTPENTIARVGMTYKKDSCIFKEYANREIYALNVSYLESMIDQVLSVIHDSIFFSPKITGNPDNPAHSLIYCSQISDLDMPEFLTRLRDHAKDKLVPADMAEVHKIVSDYRNRIGK